MGCKMVGDIIIPKQLWRDEFRFLKLKEKEKKPTPDMVNWQNKNFKYNDTDLLDHLIQGGNYGIIGGYGNLIFIDADSPEINEIASKLPDTFTVKTGNPEVYKNHYFFITDKPLNPIRLSKESIGDLGDIRSFKQYVVGAGSIHPKGDTYKIIKDLPITEISSELILEAFKGFIGSIENVGDKKMFEPNTQLRTSNYIKHCNVPDYCRKTKLKGETSKNWKLFPYIVDILHNRQSIINVYKEILETQSHQVGEISGWLKTAREGKLMKGSCKKMQEYLNYYHKDKVEEICGNCPLYKNIKEKAEIKENINYSDIQKKALLLLLSKNKEKATELIVDEIKKNNYIYTTRDDIKSEMWIYNEGIYIPEGKTYVKEVCRKILGDAFTTQLCNLVIAKIEADTYIDHDKFFNVNYIYEIPLKNGILNILTKELKPHNPKQIFFNKIPIKYDEHERCPKILEHLQNVLKTKEDVKVLLELFGYLLLKEYKIEKAFMFIGFGRNGKSKTIELMKRFIGVENCSGLPLKLLHEESFSLSELFGKMANLGADLSKSDLKETGMIKALIGRDIIQAKRKFLRDLTFVNYAKLVFASNELPKIYDTTDGFWTKWVLIEFPYKFVTQKQYDESIDKTNLKIINPEIINEIVTEDELSGLLNVALENVSKLIEQKDFSYSKNVQEVKDMWIRKSDSFTAFCYDHLEEDVDSEISKKELKRWYHKYRKMHKVSGCSEKSMKITLDNLFGIDERQDWTTKERYWEGIKLKNIEKI
jgi:P4 family phage/plasmid primase-like protien